MQFKDIDYLNQYIDLNSSRRILMLNHKYKRKLNQKQSAKKDKRHIHFKITSRNYILCFLRFRLRGQISYVHYTILENDYTAFSFFDWQVIYSV